MRYARDENHTLIFPTAEEFKGVPNWPSFDRLMRKHGYMPLVGTPEEREGYEAVRPSAWHVDGEGDSAYIQIDEWEYEAVPEPEPEPEPTPVVRYSKYKIQRACQQFGLWEQVKGEIMAAGLQDSWSNIVDIASDNKELKDALPRIRERFGSDVVNAVLAESVADE